MKPILYAATLAGLCAPFSAVAEIKFDAEAYIGHTNAPDVDATVAEAKVRAEGTHMLDNGFELSFKTVINLRSNQDDIGYVDDNIVDAEIALDMGRGGKLTFSSFSIGLDKPWADGHIRRRGAFNVWPDVPSEMMPMMMRAYPVFYEGNYVHAVQNFNIRYENNFGRLGLDLRVDPIHSVGPVVGDEVIELFKIPRAELKLSYATDFGVYSITTNDRKDYELAVLYPVAETGLILSAAYSKSGQQPYGSRSEVLMIYNTQNMGAFKGFGGSYAKNSAGRDAYLLSTNWGGNNWRAKFGFDDDRNVAVEFGYDISDNLEFLAAWDNGYDAWEGFDPARLPPVTVPPRGSAFEIGLLFKF